MPSETRSAADAFDALRAEVSKMQAELCRLTNIASRPAPNYELTLGDTARRLGAMEDRLADLALHMPPTRLPGEAALPHELAAITGQAKAAALELRAAAGAVIEQRSLRWWMIGSGGVGLLAGVLLCLAMAALLPRQAGAWTAAAILGGDPWTAGLTLMRDGDPAAFDRMARLYQACPQDSSAQLCATAFAVKAAGSR